eukprot:TRINITY_DN2278_c0_g1_i28.p1 TRINITY_DN2278_c0_g1~~TRINITY_DN2278_c0_g1_i28.p1  ORF type:complete len:145 (+),score=10.49 TRINITY_DN2278_c0_g1_i28:127-561(+)
MFKFFDVSKKLSLLDNEGEGIPSSAIRETAILQELNHPSIIRLLQVFSVEFDLFLVFEYLPHDLYSYMHDNQLDPNQTKHIMRQIFSGIDYCHGHRILHRDLKPQNVRKKIQLGQEECSTIYRYLSTMVEMQRSAILGWHVPTH